MDKYRYLILFVLLLIFLVAIPISRQMLVIGDNWEGVPPHLDADSLMYYAQIREVADGHPFIGNPVFLEHSNKIAPTFFVAHWLAAIPLIFSHSIFFTIVFNHFFWSLLTFFLLYKFLSSFKISQKWSLFGALVSFFQVYWWAIRPIVMQVVFPFIILYWLFLFIWLKEPFKKRNVVFLSLAASANFYIYSFSWQIVLATFFLAFIFFIFFKEWGRLFSLIKINLLTLIFASPFIVYTLKQINHPYFGEIASRLGVAPSYLPGPTVFIYGPRIAILLIFYFLILVWLNKRGEVKIFSSPNFIFLFLTGAALFLTLTSNIFTGKDVVIANHVFRYVILWFSLVFIYCLAYFFSRMKTISNLSWSKLIIFLTIIICFFFVLRHFPSSSPLTLLFGPSVSNILSNVFNSEAIAIMNQIAKIIILLLGLTSIYCLAYFSLQIKKLSDLPWKKVIIFSAIMTICLNFYVLQFSSFYPLFIEIDYNLIKVQSYGKPLAWIDKNVSKSSVIWANDSISNYIPILTKHYTLFHYTGALYLVSSKEVEERYLLSRYFDNLTKEDIKKDFWMYAGYGNVNEIPDAYNRKTKICHLLRLNYIGYDCGETIDAVSLRELKDEKYFYNLYDLYLNKIKPDFNQELKKFNVSYVIKDEKYDLNFQPEIITGAKLVYQDGRFSIYHITYNK